MVLMTRPTFLGPLVVRVRRIVEGGQDGHLLPKTQPADLLGNPCGELAGQLRLTRANR